MEAGPLSYRLEFAKRAEWRREDERRVRDQIKRREEKDEERERAQEGAQEQLMDYAMAMIATDAQVEQFTVKLDTYDTATIEALQKNEEALEKVRSEIRIMLDKAYVLPDGRKVFKTEDGKRVFDEHGTELKEFDPTEVEDWRPRWEQLRAKTEEHVALTEERQQLHDYQELLDKTRSDTNEEGLTKGELDDLEKRLEAAMPEAVRKNLPKDNTTTMDDDNTNEPQAASLRPAAKLDMPAL